MTRTVHEHGTRMFAQINHNGMQASSIYSRRPVLGPSPLPDPIHREMCKELEPEEIAEIVRGYALVARHVREGGFDGAELQSSHSSLIRQFFSPYYNRRTDAYGGSLENRMRFALEVIEAIRTEIGRDFTLGIRLCGDELIPAGLTLDDAREIAKCLEATGQLDFINTSIGEFHNLYLVEGSMHTPPGYQLFVSAGIREVVKLPVFCTGRIKDPVQAERILREGLADMVDVVRGQICDPAFTRKAREGRAEFGDVSRNLQREIYEAGVQVQSGVEVTAEMVERDQPDAVIIATGSRSLLPPIPGADLPHVATVWQVIQGEKMAQPGEYVLVYDQIGFHQATGTAELLAEKGCKVEFVTPQFYAGGDLGVTLELELWYRRVLAKGLRLTSDYFLAGLGPNSATLINNYTGQQRQLADVSLVVMSNQQAANDTFYHQLQGKVKQLYRVGDCIAPRRVEHAILDGERAARALNMSPSNVYVPVDARRSL